MAARVQLPPAQDRTGRYRSGITIIGVTDVETEDAVAVYDAPSGGSPITFPSPGVTSGDEGEFDAWTAPNTVSIEMDVADDSYDNPKTAELISWDAIDEAINNIPFTEISGVPGVNVMEAPYNAAGDGSTDDWAAIQQAIEDASDDGTYRGWRVVLPPGDYRISQPIVINRRGTHLLGSGRSRNVSGYTRIRPDDGVKGIIVKHPTGIGGSLGQSTNDPSDTSRGDDAILENFSVTPLDNTSGSLAIHGIEVKVRCTIKHVAVGGGDLTGFNGNGINLNASVGSGNASQTVLMDVRCEGNLRYGLETAGNDSSACTFISVSSDLNGQWGFRESSFLGNTYVGCHGRDNGQVDGTSGTYWSDSRTLFLGCYTETGQPVNDIQAPSMIVSPLGWEANAGDSILLTSGGSGMLESYNGFSATPSIGTFEAGADDNTFYIETDGTTSKAWKAIYDAASDEMQWRYGGAGGPGTSGAFAWPGSGSTRGAGYVRFREGILIGAEGTAAVTKRANAAPTTGDWLRGDIVFHSAPSAAGNVGWVCTTAGTPGTWKTFGDIAA